MAARLQKILGALLNLFILATSTLYITANADQIGSALQTLRAPALKAERLPAPPVPLHASPAAREDAAPPPVNPLPSFSYPFLLRGLSADVGQAVVLLGEGDRANLWLVQRGAEGWEVLMGPVFCRTGAQGLTLRKQEGDRKTPVGISALGRLFTDNGEPESAPEQVLHQPGDMWGIDPQTLEDSRPPAQSPQARRAAPAMDQGPALDLGTNSESSTVWLLSRQNPAPTEGDIALGAPDFNRLLALLDRARNPAAAIFRASDVGWALEPGMPKPFVFLTDAAPAVREDPRYATGDNFIGRPLAGYLGRRVVVTEPVAAALQQIAEQLAPQGLGLLVYDGYRPERAVEDIFRWLADETDQAMKQQYYPELKKHRLAGVYLDQNSPHCTGIAVDLTLCDGGGLPLDMGTGFDYFSPLSHYGAPGLTEEQAANRKVLREVMEQAGFSPYRREWWHFNYRAGSGDIRYDFVIAQ